MALTPEQITGLQDRCENIAAPIIIYLLEDAARRISMAGQMTSTAAYNLYRAKALGESDREVRRALQRLLKVSHKEIEQLFRDAAQTAAGANHQDTGTESTFLGEELSRMVEAAAQTACADFTNLTGTIGMVDRHGQALPLQQFYRQAMDEAFKATFTGAVDAVTAARRATNQLADAGIQTVDYESGVRTSIEAAARRNLLGGLGLMLEQIEQRNHEELGCTGWEISAHEGSAPDHEPIQGRQFTNEEYAAMNGTADSPGTLRRRIGTLNCKHYAWGIHLGIDAPQYTEEQLSQMAERNAAGITYQGKHYTLYEASQMQRRLERSIRKQERRKIVAKAAGDGQAQRTAALKERMLRQEYKQFSAAAGLRTRVNRLQVAKGTPTEKTFSHGVGSPVTDLKYVNSPEYRQKFNSISDNSNLNSAIYRYCKAAVTHQSGGYYENITILKSDGTLVGQSSGKIQYETFYSDDLKGKIAQEPEYTLVSIHNHGTNLPPSGADFVSAGNKRYAMGVVCCHNGEVYLYDVRNATPFLPQLLDKFIDNLVSTEYTGHRIEAHEKAMDRLSMDYGVKWRKL